MIMLAKWQDITWTNQEPFYAPIIAQGVKYHEHTPILKSLKENKISVKKPNKRDERPLNDTCNI